MRASGRARQFVTCALVTVDVRLELQRKLNSESSKQLPRLCSERTTTTSCLKRSSESRGIRLWRARMEESVG